MLDLAPEEIVLKGRVQPGPHLPRRHRARPHRVRRRAEARAGGRASVRATGCATTSSTSTSCRRRRTCRAPATRAVSQRQRHVRLHRRRPSPAADADGAERRRGDRLDGQRLGAGRAVGPLAPAVRLLQADVRAGHEPAARRHPRADGDDHGVDGGAGRQPARAAAGVVPADQDRLSGHRQRAAGAPASRLPAGVPLDHAVGALRSGARRRRASSARSRSSSSARATPSPPATPSSSCPTAAPIATGADSEPARHGRGAPAPRPLRHAHALRRWSSSRATRAKCTTARSCSGTAPAWSIRTSRSRRSTI